MARSDNDAEITAEIVLFIIKSMTVKERERLVMRLIVSQVHSWTLVYGPPKKVAEFFCERLPRQGFEQFERHLICFASWQRSSPTPTRTEETSQPEEKF